MQPFVIHAHCYQPERTNPWTGVLDPEPSAAPARDWNERILAECYRPNASARIFDATRRVERIVNNYERLSFNFGPTLLSWMEHAHPDTYARILEGDRRSVERLGHGNALAQAYNHVILPLANRNDVRTQIRWGLEDFRHRFGRDAQGLWLPEAAVNLDVIDALIDAGVAFTVLAPYQADRVREDGEEWRPADGLDTGRPYRHRHSDGSGRSLAIFFYDGALAQGIAFDPVTADAAVLCDRLTGAAAHVDGLTHAALDGETFGHHHHFGELGLAYTLFYAAEQRGMEPTNYAAYLADHPPTAEVEVVGGEGTAWSCAHGVGRWYRDCGCATDSLPGWNQAWRTPLRAALDVVRDAAADVFERRGSALLRDPWAARDDYVAVRLGTETADAFLARHAARPLTAEQRVEALTLLELQRHAMVMYTSCGWFFADVSGIETIYVLRFAARVLGLLADLGEPVPEVEVLAHLGTARSNKQLVADHADRRARDRSGPAIEHDGEAPAACSGADVWHRQVRPAAVTPARVAAHHLLLGLVTPAALGPDAVGGHTVEQCTRRDDKRGRVALTTAHLVVTATATGRRDDLALAAVHLGGVDLWGVVAPYPGDDAYAEAEAALWNAFPTVPVTRLLRLVSDRFDGDEFGFDDVLPDGRQRLVDAVFADLAARFGEQYERLYRDHQRVLEMLAGAGHELPRNLRAAAELTLAATLDRQLAEALGQTRRGPLRDAAETSAGGFTAVRDTIAYARTQGYQLDLAPVADALTEALTVAARRAAATLERAAVDLVEAWLRLSGELGVDLDLARAQEHAYAAASRAGRGELPDGEHQTVARLGTLLGLAPIAWQTAEPSLIKEQAS